MHCASRQKAGVLFILAFFYRATIEICLFFARLFLVAVIFFKKDCGQDKPGKPLYGRALIINACDMAALLMASQAGQPQPG